MRYWTKLRWVTRRRSKYAWIQRINCKKRVRTHRKRAQTFSHTREERAVLDRIVHSIEAKELAADKREETDYIEEHVRGEIENMEERFHYVLFANVKHLHKNENIKPKRFSSKRELQYNAVQLLLFEPKRLCSPIKNHFLYWNCKTLARNGLASPRATSSAVRPFCANGAPSVKTHNISTLVDERS